jgi:hypothetical protein
MADVKIGLTLAEIQKKIGKEQKAEVKAEKPKAKVAKK